VLCLLLWSGIACGAEQGMVEVWRSPFGNPRSVSVDTGSDTCWAATGCSVMHVDSDGSVLSQTDGFWNPRAVSANPADGSCWVADSENGRIVRLDSSGAPRLWVSGYGRPTCMSADSADGSVWVGGLDHALVHLAADGTPIWASWDFGMITAVSVNPDDGSCWVGYTTGADEWHVSHLAADGTHLWQGLLPDDVVSLSANAADGSSWIGCSNQAVHVDATGVTLSRTYVLDGAVTSVSADPSDGSCWVGKDAGDATLLHLAENGDQLWAGAGLAEVTNVSVSPTDGSCWLGSARPDELLRVAADGAELWRTGGFSRPASLSVDPTDNSCWVADTDNADVAHLAADGAELWRGGSLSQPASVSVYPADGSCWVGDPGAGAIVHLGQDGGELWRGSFDAPHCVAVNRADGSCWAALYNAPASEAVHLAPDGSELWRGQIMVGSTSPSSLSVNPTDGSCWVADRDYDSPGTPNDVIHLTSDGAELWRGEHFAYPDGLSVDPNDGSCWVADGELIHLDADGVELWRGLGWLVPGAVGVSAARVDERDGSCFAMVVFTRDYPDLTLGFFGTLVRFGPDGSALGAGGRFGGRVLAPWPISLGAADDSLWVADAENSQVIRLEIRHDLFPDLTWDSWAYGPAKACIEAGIVAGYADGFYRPADAVTRDQMAVYISRALAGGDDNVPEFTGGPTFPDVGAGHWALDYVEYAADRSVVAGYQDGSYHPEYQVDRGQMAVYIARSICDPTGEDGLADYTPPSIPDFPDVQAGFWAYKHIEYCYQHAVVGGYGDGLYHPANVVTRDQMVVYVARAFGLLT
jgi:DNA-binding beta-propeller fold protein YncE